MNFFACSSRPSACWPFRRPAPPAPAESWTNFVLKPRPEGKRIADEKALFFYDFPELVAFQQQVIAGLCSYGR